MDRYVGLDVHAASCTAAVVGPSGRHLTSQVLETNARSLIEFLQTLPRPRHVCLEEGTHAAWLHEMLSPHVEELVVTGVARSRGPKSDRRDAFGLADALRVGTIETRVYKGLGEFKKLRELSRAYTMLVSDSVRCQNRIKSVYRSRGIATAGKDVYGVSNRSGWLSKLPPEPRQLVAILYRQLDATKDLVADAGKEMVREARRHAVYRVLTTCPGMGSIRVSQMMPIVITPYRFPSKRSFWAYAGMGIVMRSSSDWVRTDRGAWVRAEVQQTRGLTRRGNRMLKTLFKGAATTIIGRARSEDPLFQHYVRLLDGGTKPNLAKLTIARQIASIILSIWRSNEPYDPRRLTHT